MDLIPKQNVDIIFSKILITIGVLFVAGLILAAIFVLYKGNIMEQIAAVQCQASTRTAKNHVISNLERCDQSELVNVENGNSLEVYFPVGDSKIEGVYNVEYHENDDMYVLTYTISGKKSEVAQYLDGGNGFQVSCDKQNGIISFTIRTKQKLQEQHELKFELSGCHNIREYAK